MSELWYAINSHPNKEELLFKLLTNMGLECFFPCLKVKPVNPRARKIKPYFPGYLFIKTDLNGEGTSMFQWMPYSRGIVSFGGEPAIVPDGLIQGIKNRLAEIGEESKKTIEDLQNGQPVKIIAGPFLDYEAIFDTRIDGKERVRVLLIMLNKQLLPIEMKSSQISQKKKTLPGNLSHF
ncbi:MAG: transcription termination/antitermination NusG family protein [Anaerolineaceae bacterium]